MDGTQGAAPPPEAWRPWSDYSRALVVFLSGERAAAERVSLRLFGRVLRPREYAGLAGAPDDAKVDVGASAGRLYLELRQATAAAYRGYYYVYGRKGAVVLLNDGFGIQRRAMQRQGLGLQMFYRQARNAAAHGVARIDALAGRRNDENGYYTWPRYGFDGRLPRAMRRCLPAGLTHARTLLDVMACAEGREWWRAQGATVRVRFDLAAGSRSWRTLAEYVRGRTASIGRPEAAVHVTR
jgi:hypothetical protein